ncbi:hypothetical protein [Actinomadura sp. 6N118]|uniref:hypothetical protein n=1 Tax=Actinomadura sp. 6N118 TaxID=3375151 RepID=UPI0037B3E0DE
MTTVNPMPPDQLTALQARAERVHPDEPVATAREVLALIAQTRDATGTAAAYATAARRVTEIATQWAASRDIQQAAAGRIVLAAQGGRRAALTGLI